MVTAKPTRPAGLGPWARQHRWLLAGLLVLAAGAAGAVYALGNFSGCRPTFADEFNFWWLDPYQWNVKYNSGRNELQYYAPDAFKVSGGLLRITAERRPRQGHAYSSGIITTRSIFAQQYGYFEMRAQLPAGQGLWPAFWTMKLTRPGAATPAPAPGFSPVLSESFNTRTWPISKAGSGRN